MYDRILVPTDGSDPARGALEYALALAERTGAAVDLLHVVDADAYDADRRRDHGRELLSAARSMATDHGVEATTELVDGAPDDRIRRYVQGHGVDLIAMGTHGHSGLEDRLLGSVTDRVLRRAGVPVLAVPPGVEPPVIDRICWPTDGSDHAAAVAPHAASLASAFDASVTALHAVDVQAAIGPFDAGGVDAAFVERLESEGESITTDATATLAAEYPDVDAASEVVRGRPDRAILEYVADAEVDLLTIGAGDRSRLGRAVLGSVTDRLVRASPVPVLVVIDEA